MLIPMPLFHSSNQYNRSCKYDPTQSVFCNTYPWLFPGGVGDLYDIKRGQHCPKERRRHLLHYHDGRFLKDQMFSLFVFNSIECHSQRIFHMIFLDASASNWSKWSSYLANSAGIPLDSYKQNIICGQQTFCQDGRFVRKTFCQDRLRRFVRTDLP